MRRDADRDALVDPEGRLEMPHAQGERDQGQDAECRERGDAHADEAPQNRGSAQGDGGHGAGGYLRARTFGAVLLPAQRLLQLEDGGERIAVAVDALEDVDGTEN